MSRIFIHKTRGPVVECVHRGDAVVVGPQGNIITQSGDPRKYTYFRSSAKPMQALNVILSGAAERFGLTDAELALTCASHYAEDFHLEAVRSILTKSRVDEKYLNSGVAWSIRPEIAQCQIAAGISKQRILSDCSGKHAGMLASCAAKGYPLEGYTDPQHPIQQEILDILAGVCDYPREQIAIGTDGCNVPVFALPIYNMALGYARLASPKHLPAKYRAAAKRIFTAMNAHPHMVSGTNGFCTELMRATGGRLIGKVGAQGVYCVGIREPAIGIAIKIEDGTPGMASMAMMHILKALRLLSEDEYRLLERFHHMPNLNDDGHPVGEIFPVFRMAGPRP